MRKKQNQVTLILNWWIHHWITVLLYLPYGTLYCAGAKQPQKITRQEQSACLANTVTACCRNNFQASGASLQAIAHLHSKSQLKLLQQWAA